MKRIITLFGALLLIFALLFSCDAQSGIEEITSDIQSTEALT